MQERPGTVVSLCVVQRKNSSKNAVKHSVKFCQDTGDVSSKTHHKNIS